MITNHPLCTCLNKITCRYPYYIFSINFLLKISISVLFKTLKSFNVHKIHYFDDIFTSQPGSLYWTQSITNLILCIHVWFFFINDIFGERHLSELTGQKSEIKTDIRATTCNPFERKFNNPFERK